MGRAPCCEKMGLKKGPWTPEEDQILITYINLHGHTNWRALPKHAGLLRCGKSCRLRWTNYLRPDIKRGNFTQQEEETIIKLHEMLGNRWSAIAAKLPGRTDNEIKNVWHTHLKKRLPKHNEKVTSSTITPVIVEPTKKRARKSRASKKSGVHEDSEQRKHVKREDSPVKDSNDNNNNNNNENEGDNVQPTKSIKLEPVSPQPCTSEVSTITSTSASENDNFCNGNVGETIGYTGDFAELNDDFWMEVLSVEDTAMSTEDLPSVSPNHMSTSPDVLMEESMCAFESKVHSEEMDIFWHNLLTKSEDLPEFSEIM